MLFGFLKHNLILFYIAKMLNKKAGCIVTVVDSRYRTEEVTVEQREKKLDNMIKIALEASLNL